MCPKIAETPTRPLILLAVALACVLFAFPLTIFFPLLDPDEGLHAAIAQEMVEQGDWVTPTFLGRPFLDKPILYFWVQAASLSLLGSNETAVRLPGLVFGLLGAITTGLLGRRLFTPRIGWLAGILYATTILPTAMAQAASHDVALIPWINLAVLLLWESDRMGTGASVMRCLVGAGLFAGLAILTKGLFGLAAVGVAYGSYVLATRRMTFTMILHGLSVLVVAVLVALPWFVLMDRENPTYLGYFFVERHLLGFATDSQPHGDQPWWYYLPVLLGGGLPWIGYLPISGAWPSVQRSRATATPPGEDCATTLLWCWLVCWTLLMWMAGSKLATYLWPIFPPIAILAATAWESLIQGELTSRASRAFSRTFTCSACTGPLVLPGAVLAIQIVYEVPFSWHVWLAVAIAALLSPLPWIAWREGRWQTSLTAAVVSVALQFVVVMACVLPPVAESCSGHALARHFNEQGQLPSRLLVVEGRIGSLVFYLDPQLRKGVKGDRIFQTTAKELPPLRSGDMIAVPEWRIAKLRGHFDIRQRPYESFGVYRLYHADDVSDVDRHRDSKRASSFGTAPISRINGATAEPAAAPNITSLGKWAMLAIR